MARIEGGGAIRQNGGEKKQILRMVVAVRRINNLYVFNRQL